jgi:polyisoprenoid-binding protein YceI
VKKISLALALGLSLSAAPLLAQTPPPATGAAAVQAGSYKLDANHTQVIWSVDHLGFSKLYGMVGSMSGTLQIDPANLSAAKVEVDIPLSGLTVTSPAFAKHLASADFFETEKFPTARFVSRTVEVKGEEATITGDLTLKGVTRPVVLNAKFYGAGVNAMNKARTVGFSATGTLKRSEFGVGYAAPAVSDDVQLKVTAAFEAPAS